MHASPLRRPAVRLPVPGSFALPTALGAAPERLAAGLRRESAKPGASLLPLRLFIGIGWLRACAEKLPEPGWRDGSSLAAFLRDQLAGGRVPFPVYETAIRDWFLPHAAALGWAIVVGQLLVGIAVLCGGFTNAALLAGLAMNANFLFAGQPTPSAFYIVIQVALLAANAGAVFGADAALSRRLRSPLLCAQTGSRPRSTNARTRWFVLALTLAAVAIAALRFVHDFGAAGSVEDPAVIVAVVAGMGAAWAVLSYLRGDPAPRHAPEPRAKPLGY